MLRKRTLGVRRAAAEVGGIPPSETSDPAPRGYADAVLANLSTGSVVVVSAADGALDLSPYPAAEYAPIGVVAVPGVHDAYGTGECGVMSAKAMDCSSPSDGSGQGGTMGWGPSGTDIAELPNLNVVPVCASVDTNDCARTDTYAYLPSTAFDQGTGDGHARYLSSDADWYPPAPSPYLASGGPNPAYRMTASPSSSANALSDFNGRSNTAVIVAQRGERDYASWAPTSTVSADYPAASCCDMFRTAGTRQGDWYLPACGELGYIVARYVEIQNTLGALSTAYGESACAALDDSAHYWSSSESNGYSANTMYTASGGLYNTNNFSSGHVRAFLRLG